MHANPSPAHARARSGESRAAADAQTVCRGIRHAGIALRGAVAGARARRAGQRGDRIFVGGRNRAPRRHGRASLAAAPRGRCAQRLDAGAHRSDAARGSRASSSAAACGRPNATRRLRAWCARSRRRSTTSAAAGCLARARMRAASTACARVVGNVMHSYVMDRVFRDDEGMRWIADYKTSSHEGAMSMHFSTASACATKRSLRAMPPRSASRGRCSDCISRCSPAGASGKTKLMS